MLREILRRTLKPGRKLAFAGLLAFLGVSLLLGDGAITPAITILSAVEGMLLIPGLENLRLEILMLVAATIAVGLFALQSKGTDKVARIFGPVMLVWFICLAVTGFVSVASMPGILKSISPYYAFKFLAENGIAGFFVLSEVHSLRNGRGGSVCRYGPLRQEADPACLVFRICCSPSQLHGPGCFCYRTP
jgi:KUP system potassium uptake protein